METSNTVDSSSILQNAYSLTRIEKINDSPPAHAFQDAYTVSFKVAQLDASKDYVTRRPTKRDGRHWIKIASVVFTAGWCGNSFTSLLYEYRHAMHWSSPIVNFLLFVYVLGIMPTLLVAGPLSDRYGRKPLLYIAPYTNLLSSIALVCGSTQDLVGMVLIGRALAGISLGIAMVVGGSWIKELSTAQFSPANKPGTGAMRHSVFLTSGFALGAFVAGTIAQFTTEPELFPFIINAIITLPTFFVIRSVPETKQGNRNGRLLDDLRIPYIGHAKFVRIIIPAAVLVLSSAAVAYAVLPAQLNSSYPLEFSAVMCAITLGSGFIVQLTLAKRITGVRGILLGMSFAIVGFFMASAALYYMNFSLAVLAAIILGAAFGYILVAGLAEVQSMATPDDLAGLTAVYYAIVYLCFGTSFVLALLSRCASYSTMLSGLAIIGIVLMAIAYREYRKEKFSIR